MENKFEKIITGFLAVLVLIAGLMFFVQQKAINEIKAQISGKSIGLSGNSASPAKNKILDPGDQKFLGGEIKSVAADSLNVEASLRKLKDPKKFNTDKPVNMGPDDFETITKTVKVLLNDKTSFVNRKKEELKVGDKVAVDTDKAPYSANTVTALKVTAYIQPQSTP
jgi:hypothetical protein